MEDADMRYSQIRKQDVSNGDGIGVAVFCQGCHFHCKNCFNSETWDFEGGTEWTKEQEDFVIDISKKPYITRLSLLGGEPINPANLDGMTALAKLFKERYPDKKVWLWTGYSYEHVKELEIYEYLDYIIDGQFIDKLKDFKLKYRGSSNQRVWKKENNVWKQLF